MSPLAQEYSAALASYLTGDGEAALKRAYEFGRNALMGGLGVLEIAILHHQSLQRLTPKRKDATAKPPKLKTAGEFLAESLAVYDMAYRSFKEKNAALRHLNDALENEARRIAYLLHDEVGQSLFVAEISLAQLEGKIDPALHEMRPTVLDDLGLVPALEFLAQGVSKRSRVRVIIRSSVRRRLPAPIEATLFRAVQEALSNVVRHSNADQADVALQQKGQTLFCSVTDEGVGFDVEGLGKGNSEGLGLTGIRERLDSIGGTLEIRSQTGQGTQLTMIIPCEV
jgi:signal transduction histidine kinase